MKRGLGLLPLFLLCSLSMAGQADHATIPQQCRADASAWGVPGNFRAPGTVENMTVTAINSPTSARTLDARMSEMVECVKTDSWNSDRYAGAREAYMIAELARMSDYIKRHNLTDQFYQEDEQGER
jgi:hypothetical protein